MDRESFLEKYGLAVRETPVDEKWHEVCDRCRTGKPCMKIMIAFGHPIVSGVCPFTAELSILGVVVINEFEYFDLMHYVLR